MCKIAKNLRRIIIVIEIAKDTAMFIRENAPNTCIVKTMSGHTSKRGKYYTECTNSVMTIINEYNKLMKITETYPSIKE